MTEVNHFEDLLLRSARNGDYKTIIDLINALDEGRIKLNLSCKGQSKCNLGWTPLHLSCYFGHRKCVEVLLHKGVQVDVQNECGDTALHKAALTNRDSEILLLLEHGANVSLINGEGKSAAEMATESHARQLIQGAERADRKSREEKLLHAAREGDVTEVKILLQSPFPPNINCTDSVGNTALHCAAYRGHANVSILLIQNGCDPSIKNNAGQTCLSLVKSSALQQVLAVSPLRSFERNASRFEGPLLRRMRIVGWRMVWAVLERGVLSFFSSRGDASSGIDRRDYKYLDNSIVLPCSSPDPSLFTLQYSDNTRHRFAALHDPMNSAGVNRQKWMSAFEKHIKFSTHYVQHGFSVDSDDDDEDRELKPLGCMEDSFSTAKAHQHLLDQQLDEVVEWVKQEYKDDMKDGPTLTILKKFSLLTSTAKSMMSMLEHCLMLMKQQEEVRNLQLKEEREKVRVLEESLRVLAKEHNDLEESVAESLSPQNANGGSDEESIYGTPANSFASGYSSRKHRRAFDDEEFFDVLSIDEDACTLRSISPCDSECSTNTLVSCMSSLPLDPQSPEDDRNKTPTNTPPNSLNFNIGDQVEDFPSSQLDGAIGETLMSPIILESSNDSVTRVTPLSNVSPGNTFLPNYSNPSLKDITTINSNSMSPWSSRESNETNTIPSKFQSYSASNDSKENCELSKNKTYNVLSTVPNNSNNLTNSSETNGVLSSKNSLDTISSVSSRTSKSSQWGKSSTNSPNGSSHQKFVSPYLSGYTESRSKKFEHWGRLKTKHDSAS